MGRIFSETFQSDINRVKPIVKRFLTCLVNMCPDIAEDDLDDIKIVINEMLLNAVIHGNCNNTSKKVVLDCYVTGSNTLKLTIHDEGDGFDYVNLLREIETTSDIFKESGRGIKLALKLSDKIKFNDVGNSVKIYKQLYL